MSLNAEQGLQLFTRANKFFVMFRTKMDGLILDESVLDRAFTDAIDGQAVESEFCCVRRPELLLQQGRQVSLESPVDVFDGWVMSDGVSTSESKPSARFERHSSQRMISIVGVTKR